MSKFTVLLMSVVVSMAADSTVGVATAIIVLVGLGLFLLPPVPGIPIYFMSGMMLLAVCEPSMGLFGGVVYCTLLGLVLKLTAGTIQQQVSPPRERSERKKEPAAVPTASLLCAR